MLKCLNVEEVNYVLSEVYEGSSESHVKGQTLARKVLVADYFWPTLERDIEHLVATCLSCQKHQKQSQLPTKLLKMIIASCPFDRWRLDIIGPFSIETSQKKFLLVMVNYFSKWVEAESLTQITEEAVLNFLWKNIIYRFGIPLKLISNNDGQFQGKKFKE